MKRLILAAFVFAGCGASTPAPQIVSFVVRQPSILAGGSTFVQFQVIGAESLRIDPDLGDVTGRSTAVVGPALTTTYTLTATNKGGSTSAKATLIVNPQSATLSSFFADPDSAGAGSPVTLRWNATNAVALTLLAEPAPTTPLPHLGATDTQVVVRPQVSTRYTLVVGGAAGTLPPATRSTVVAVAAIPTVILSADATSVARGASTTLRWASNVRATYTLVATPHDGPVTKMALGTLTSSRVRPLGDTDYAVEALGPGGPSISNATTVSVTGPIAAALAYVAPAPGTGDAVALQLRSTAAGVATLDLVALKPIAAGALALELPLDGAAAGSRDGSTRVVLDAAASGDAAPGLGVNASVLDPGSSPAAAVAALSGSGPSAGVLLVAIAQKPSCAGCAGGVGADRAIDTGTVIATIRLKVVAAAGAGPVFDPAALDAAHGFRTAVRSGTTGATLGTIAVGALSAN